MFEAQAICTPTRLQLPIFTRNCISRPRIGFVARISNPNELLCQTHSCSFLSPLEDIRTQTRFTFNASSSSGKFLLPISFLISRFIFLQGFFSILFYMKLNGLLLCCLKFSCHDEQLILDYFHFLSL